MPGKNHRKPSDPDAIPQSGNSFRKYERLSGRALISGLFQEGSRVQSPEFTIYFRVSEFQGTPARVAISVPRRHFRKAVDRNLLKRRIREAYRLIKPEFYNRIRKAGKQVHLAIIYKKQEISDFRSIQQALSEAIGSVEQKLKKTGHRPANT